MAIQKHPVTSPIICLNVMFFFIILCTYACSNETSKEPMASDSPKGFTFFELGSNSLLSDQVRDKLEDRLGSEAIARRTTIDLSIHFPGFLEKYFSHLDELNDKINWPPRERVEHNVTKLMYRYASQKKLPFTYVELFFSNYTRKPLFFRINANPKGASVVEALKNKYGPHQVIEWSETGEHTLHWQKQKDVLIVSQTQDRLGEPEYLFCIFHVKNLEELVETEKIERETREERIENAGKTAF